MISRETIAAIKDRADIVALVGENVRLKKQGRRYLGLCPFHKEKTPSFSVNPDRNLYYCFGCKESGGAIDWLMKLEGLTFPEAARALAERLGIVIEENRDPEEREREERRRRGREQLYDLNQMVATWFEQQLREGGHPLAHLAREELERRGLPLGTSEATDETLAAFRIGYAPYGWDALKNFLEKQGSSPAAAERLGLLAARSSGSGHYDAFRHRLMFAVVDKSGRVVAFSGRALAEPSEDELQRLGIPTMYRDRGDEPRRDPPKYVNSPESPIYVKGDTVFGLFQARHAIREQQTAVVVEGNFDVVSLHARGIRHVVAPLGTAFTLAQAKLVKRYAPTLVTLFDADSAGRQAVLKLRGPAAEGGLAVKVANLPTGKDPDDFVRETGAEALAALLAGARGMLEHLIESTLSGEEVRGGSLRDKQARIAEVMKYLSEERDPNVRAMAKSLADRISAQLIVAGRSPSDLRGLERMIGQSLRAEDAGGQPDAVVQQGPRARSEPRPHEIGLAVLGAILDFPELLDDEEVNLALEALEGEVVMGVAAVRQMWDSKKSLDAAEVLDLMPAAIHTFAEPRLVAPVFTQVDEARTELLENTKKLRRLALQGHRVQALDELAKAEQLGDDQAQDDLLRELARRSKEKLGLSK